MLRVDPSLVNGPRSFLVKNSKSEQFSCGQRHLPHLESFIESARFFEKKYINDTIVYIQNLQNLYIN